MKLKRQITARQKSRFYLILGSSLALSTSNYFMLPAQSQEIVTPLDKACVFSGTEYERCDRVEMANGYFDHYTDGEEFCTR